MENTLYCFIHKLPYALKRKRLCDTNTYLLYFFFKKGNIPRHLVAESKEKQAQFCVC